jgi:hypothetical protein
MLGKRNYFTRKKLEEHGTVAKATVVEISDKAMAVTHGAEGPVSNTELIVKTRLRVEPEGEPSFEVHQKFRYPQLDLPGVGSVLTVRFDPEDHDKVMLDPDARESATGRLAASLGGVAGNPGEGPGNLGGILAAVQQARSEGGQDPNAVAEALRKSFGAQGMTVIDASGAHAAGAAAAEPQSPEEERIENLERLVALRDKGALTAAEFAAQKAALLAES